MGDKNARLSKFFDRVHSLTDDVISELFLKWEAMYEFTPEIQTNRLEKFLEYLKDFYDEIVANEEEKRISMLNKIDKCMKEYHNLLKDLQISNEQDIRWINVKEPYTLFLDEITNSMKKYEVMRDSRLEQLESLRSREKELCDLLELNPLEEFPNAIPSEQDLQNIESHIFELNEEKIHRTEIYKDCRERIIDLMKQMDHTPETEFEVLLISTFEDAFIPSGSNMNKLQDLKENIEREYSQKQDYRTSLIEKLTKLWDRIKTEQSDRDAFLAKWDSVEKSHFKAINEEIVRCEEIKLANIKPLVEQLRVEIKMYWDLLTYTDEQRNEFKAYTTDHFTEDVLDLHELEVERLQQYYEKYQHIFDLAEKRNQLWERMLHLDEIAMDKTRLFNNRGGQLLKEEKERKTLEINLPKVDKQLKSALSDYCTEEGRPFLWYGVNLLEQITKDWEERLAAKECKKAIRKVENKKLIEEEAKLGSRIISKRKMGTPLSNVSQAKARRCDDLGSQTIVLKAGVRTPRKLPNIRTPLNISTASIASYSHFQDGLEKPTSATPRSALKEVGNRVPGIGHSSPTLATPVGRRGTPASVVKSNAHTIPRLVRARTRLPLDF